MTDLEQRLAATFEVLAEEAPHDPDLLGSVRSAGPSRRPWLLAGAAVAAVAAGVALTVTLVDRGPDTTPVASGGTYDCPARVAPALLPAWARTGFSDPKPEIPYVAGADGGIVGILFGQPLTSPPADGRGNKVLWVVQEDAGPLRIEARLGPDDEPVVVDSVTGPSTLDLPQAGCWHLDLAWGNHTDAVNLRYVAP